MDVYHSFQKAGIWLARIRDGGSAGEETVAEIKAAARKVALLGAEEAVLILR